MTSPTMTSARYELVAAGDETADVKRLIFRCRSGLVPDWQAGAHVRVALPSGGSRAYSLIRLPDLASDMIALGVLRETESTGGSIFMHGLGTGEQIEITGPENHFPLGPHDAPALLIAGGIGVTPILSMADELARAGRPFEMHYAGRSEGKLAFVDALRAICGDRLHLHYDDQDNALDIKALLAGAADGAHAYICGPAGMIEAVRAEAKAQGWADERIHFELFTADQDDAQNTAFDVEIHSTGQVVHVPADKTIIEALEDAGLDPLYDCQRGDCGICQCDVIEGEPDHRDVILTDDEKASNTVMQICVSRAKTPKLVIDI